MERTVRFFERGQIFYLADKDTKEGGRVDKHNYIIMSDTYGELQKIQCMGITSMSKGESEWGIPLVMSNGYVSYITAFNIYSYLPSEFSLKDYNGVLCDDILKKNEFMEFIMDVFLVSNGFPCSKSVEVVKQEYDEYCKNFWNKYDNVQTYSEHRYGVNPRAIVNTKNNPVEPTPVETKTSIESAEERFSNKIVIPEEVRKTIPAIRKFPRIDKMDTSDIVKLFALRKSRGNKYMAEYLGLKNSQSVNVKFFALKKEVEKRGINVDKYMIRNK